MTRAAADERSGDALALGLGWFSIALGVAELAAPDRVARLIGLPPTDATINTLRAFGARELGNGAAILADPQRSVWLWSRAAGDAVDLATLAAAMNEPETDKRRAWAASTAVLAVAALDVYCAQRLAEQRRGERRGERREERAASRAPRRRVREAITINAPIERVRERWHNAEAMPESLRALRGANQTAVEFRPAPGNRGTEVFVQLDGPPGAGAIGTALARLFGGDPTGRLREDLRRFKQIVETGEIVLSEGPSLWRPAQPAASREEILHAAGVGV